MLSRWTRWGCAIVLAIVVAVAGRTLQPTAEADKLDSDVIRLNQAGKYIEAIPIAERALVLRETVLGPEHPSVAASLNSLATLYERQGRTAEAEPLYKRTLAQRETALGPEHSDVAQSLNNLAGLYLAQGRYSEAEPLYKRSLAIAEKALGPEHPNAATSLNNLADLYRNQGRFAEAEPLYKRSLGLREKALGPEHPSVATSLNSLAMLYEKQGRTAETEQLYKRSLGLREKALGPEHPDTATSLNNLAELYRAQGRFAEAEPLYKRSLAIAETALGPEHPNIANSLNNLAALYMIQARYPEAELQYKRAIKIFEKALGPQHPWLASALNNLAVLYESHGRYPEAELQFKRSLVLRETALGPEHPDVAGSLNNLAWLALAQGDLAGATDGWRRATALIQRRAERGLIGAAERSATVETKRSASYFEGLVKTTHRLAAEDRGNVKMSAMQMFETAQWAASSEAAASLALMAARSAGGSPELAKLGRERQDLIAERHDKDNQLIAAMSEPPAERNAAGEKALTDRLSVIDSRLAAIGARFTKDFPDYAALASPKPISVTDVQAYLRDDEALLLFLDTGAGFKSLPEETFVWVVTRTDVRWVKSDLGSGALKREVTALRCGLDAMAWYGEGALRCANSLKLPLDKAPREGEALPFDAARAHALYTSLFGEVRDLIRGKHLLIVPSGALTTLPFQVLVPALPADVTAGTTSRIVGRLGAEFGPLSADDKKDFPSDATGGVRIVKPVLDGPAEAAGLRASDIFLAVDGKYFGTIADAIATVQAAGPGRAVSLKLLRDGLLLDVNVTLGSLTVNEWIPLFLDSSNSQQVALLIRDHAITVLPSVASIAALRRTGKPSAATRPVIGFGNPLLDGNQSHPTHGAYFKQQASLAKAQTGCAKAAVKRTAALRVVSRSLDRAPLAGGRVADLAHLKLQAPLPETADELCEVARSVGASVETDVHIGARATETEVKRLAASGELAKYRMLHFATHGTLAGQLKGTSEPGLILTPPPKATAEDDGYLSGSEIAALKLDADWVILSACNTAGGAGDGGAADALSGLARVFFYAGARALLVSHWEVDSDAAVKLVTGAIGAMVKDQSIGRAEALRRAMLAVMADTTRPANWLPAWHPAVWAPFVVVGEGGVGR